MSSRWTEVTLRSVAEVIMGQSPPGSTYNEEGDGLPFFQGVKDFNYRHPTTRVYCSAPSRIAQPGDILLSVRAPIGQVNVADRVCAIGRGLSIIRARNPRDCRFIEFVLRFLEPSWHAIEGTGSVFGNATKKDLESLILPWPPERERHAIGHILGTLDDKIELLRRMNETLEAMAQALFKSWFVDFDPVIDNALEAGNPIPDQLKGKAKRRLALGNKRKPLPKHIRRLFPDRFIASELGPIPAGWGIRSLDEIAEYLNGVAWQKYRAKEGEPSLPVIKIRELREGITPASDRASLDVPEEYIVEDGDVLFSWSGSLLVKIWCGGQGILNQHLFKVSSKHYPKWFYYLWTSEHLDRFQRIAADKATTMGHIKRSHLSESYVLVPNSTLLGKMTTIIEPLVEKQIANKIACRTLANIRDALLPKLISGEIRVENAEEFLEERGPC
ncbi:MAG: restriction endonuclease subunit S [Planctomycetota bacterium]|nr:MAG: restriction endonuclease subunit S [Planctomycetota bacterium]